MPQYPIERYLNIKMAYGAQFNGDPNTIVFLSNITGVAQVWQVEIDAAGNILWPQQMSFAADRVMGVWSSPADKRMIYAHDVGGSENAQLFLLDPQTGVTTRLTHDDGAIHGLSSWSDDASQILFAANRRNRGLFDLYIQKLDGSEAQLVYENPVPGYLAGAKFSPDGKRILAHHMIASFHTSLLEIDIESGIGRIVSPEEEGVRYAGVTYLDADTALVITDKDSDFLYVARLDLRSQKLEALIVPDWDVEEILLSKDHRSLAYTVNVDGSTELYLRDMTTGETKRAEFGADPGVISEISFSSDGSRLLLTANRAKHTADIFVWEIKDHTLRPVTKSSHAGIPVETFSAPELIHFPSFDQDENGQTRQIPAWLFKPEQAQAPYPVVMYVHGGPEGQAQPQFMFFFQYLLNNGFAVFVPNVRGSTGYGKAYSHLDDVRLRMDSVKDLAYGAEWIKQQSELDGDRLAIYGRSYGGFMVLSAITTYPDLWVAAVDVVGISNFVTFLENTSAYRRAHREAEYGSLANDRDFLEEISPANHLDQITAPLFVLHGANDPRVPVSEAQQLVAALEKRGVPVDLLIFDDEGHQFSKLKNKLVEYPRVIEFLKKYMMNSQV